MKNKPIMLLLLLGNAILAVVLINLTSCAQISDADIHRIADLVNQYRHTVPSGK